MRRFPIERVLIAAIALVFIVAAAGSRERAPVTPGPPPEEPGTVRVNTTGPKLSPQPDQIVTQDARPAATVPMGGAARPYSIDWFSVNGGGATRVQGTAYELGLSVGQPVAGFVTGGAYQMGIGFWYGAAAAACPVVETGDVNLAGGILTSDIIYLVNYVLKLGPEPLPCVASGDVNCDGNVLTSDIIYLVNYVLKGGPVPCDVCTLIPGTWSCP